MDRGAHSRTITAERGGGHVVPISGWKNLPCSQFDRGLRSTRRHTHPQPHTRRRGGLINPMAKHALARNLQNSGTQPHFRVKKKKAHSEPVFIPWELRTDNFHFSPDLFFAQPSATSPYGWSGQTTGQHIML